MTMAAHGFKRIVLRLQPRVPDRTARLAVELAELLDLDLLGLFLDDTSLRDLASLPFARELRTLGGGWQPLDIERLSRELDTAARSAERLFAEMAQRIPARCRFEVVRGSPRTAIEATSRVGDIVVILEPGSPSERFTDQFSWLSDAAFRSAAAVLLVPPRIARTIGPIVAVAAAPDDPCIDTALVIAAAAKEELVVIEAHADAGPGAPLPAMATERGVRVRRVSLGPAGAANTALLAGALERIPVRLIVLTQGAFDRAVATAIASAQQVPVLVLEPRPPDAASERAASL